MRNAGCVGIDFGADHGDDNMLRRLGHNYSSDDLTRIREICLRQKIICMFDLLLGSPGETKQSIETTIHLMKKIKPVLTDAIKCGHRGAYWDILRRVSEGIPPLS